MNTVVTDAAGVVAGVDWTDWVGFDVETTGTEPYTDKLVLLQFASADRLYVIDVRDHPDLTPLETVLPTARLLGHNIRFDLSFLWTAGLPMPASVFDTMLASQLLDGGRNLHRRVPDPTGRIKRGKPVSISYHSLGALANRELGIALDKSQQTVFVDDPLAVLADDVLDYASEDVRILRPIADLLVPRLMENGLGAVAKIEMRCLLGLLWVDMNGIPLDQDRWIALRDRAVLERDKALVRIEEVAPGLNPASWQQVKKFLWEHGVEVPDTKEATLKQFWDGHPLIDALLTYRDWHKKADTYGDGYLVLINPVTHRVHVSYNQIGAESGRMSSSKKNIQNIPRDPLYRACFKPEAPNVLVKCDYAQIEFRIAAVIANDLVALTALRDGVDIHTLTATEVMGVEPTKENRQKAKPVNFGLIYGIGAPKLTLYARDSYGIVVPVDEWAAVRRRWFLKFAGIRRWHGEQREGPVNVRTATGRVRYAVTKFTEKVNTPVQGSGADILKLALAMVWERRDECPTARPVAVVHDEIVLEVPVDDAPAAARWVQEIMIEAALGVFPDSPMDADAAIAADWSGTPLEGTKPMSQPQMTADAMLTLAHQDRALMSDLETANHDQALFEASIAGERRLLAGARLIFDRLSNHEPAENIDAMIEFWKTLDAAVTVVNMALAARPEVTGGQTQ